MNILFWSTGKDSTATGIIAKKKGIKIDRIICSLPDPFKLELELKERFEYFMKCKVEFPENQPTFSDYFFRKKVRGKYKGSIYGFPMMINKTCARILKWQPMNNMLKDIPNFTGFIGIAKNEKRSSPSKNNRSLLLENGITEEDAKNLCIDNMLLNPLYKHFNRTGCVRCPKQSLKSIKIMRELEPEKYRWLLNHDHLSPVKFKPNQTFTEIHKKLNK